jgi:hypothetical protein
MFEESRDTANNPTSEPATTLTYLLPADAAFVICASPPFACVPIYMETVDPRGIAEHGDVHEVG